MINIVARHKLRKLRHSRMFLIFALACVFISLFTVVPMIILGAIAGQRAPGGQAAGVYFGMVVFFGCIAGILLGVTTWRQDYRDGTLLTFMARPISRIELFVGKVLGATYALMIYLGGAVVLYLILHLLFFRSPLPLVSLVYLVQVLSFFLAFFSLGAFFSSFAAPVLAATMTVGLIILGSLGEVFAGIPKDWSRLVGQILKFITINTNLLYNLQEVLTADVGSPAALLTGIGYFLLWSVTLLSASIVLFNRQEFLGKRS